MRASAAGSPSLTSLRARTHRSLCRVLVEARKSAGLSQQELARRIDRSEAFIAKIEGGERQLRMLEFWDIAIALNQNPAELISKVKRD